MRDARYLSDLGPDRERVAIDRWCLGHFPELLAAVGLRRGWWVGFGLGRREVFDEGDGDVDILAGPMEMTWSQRDRKDIVREQAAKYPRYPTSWLRNLALLRAGELGLVEWPPKIGFVAAIEAKASYFDGETWKRRHDSRGERAELRGQVDLLHDHGINSVSFLHIASTTPAGTPGHSWVPAADRMDLANRIGFPNAFEPDGRTGVLRAFMAAIPEGTEDMDGIHEGLTILHPPAHRTVEARPWHARLHARLADLPRPSYFRTTVVPCATCRRWMHRNARGSAAHRCPAARP
ncbi:MAG TPA: hypothetical protein VHO06_20110 [Polyangia bacterium]|nr:hypothetical protein [Polyangia bacterium]